MVYMEEKELHKRLEAGYRKGVLHGVKLMKRRMLIACEQGTPINIEEKAYFTRSDMDNLKDIFEGLEKEHSSNG